MGIVVIGAVFVDIKGYPLSTYIPGGRNSGRVEQVHGGVSRNIVEDIANVELRPTFVGLVDDTGMGQDVINKLENHKVNTKYIQRVPDGMGIQFDETAYLTDPAHEIHSRYVLTAADTPTAARLQADDWTVLYESDRGVLYER